MHDAIKKRKWDLLKLIYGCVFKLYGNNNLDSIAREIYHQIIKDSVLEFYSLMGGDK